MRESVIRYNRKMAEFFLLHKQFDALTLYYLLKITHTNSIIYKLEGFDLYDRLKAEKKLPLNFSRERFKSALIFLAKHGYIYNDKINVNHVGIVKVTKNIGYYKSKIRFNKNKINFNIIQRLLLKEELLYTKKKQEQAMAFREKVATNKNKALGSVKCKRKKSDEDTLNNLGECYLNQVSFTYRKIAKVYGVSLGMVNNCIDWIRNNSKLQIQKITECKHRVFKKEDFADAKNKFYPNTFVYLTKANNIVAVFGSSIITT